MTTQYSFGQRLIFNEGCVGNCAGSCTGRKNNISDENLKLLQKEVHAANLKQRAKDLKEKLRKEKLMKKKKQKETYTKTEV